MKQPIVGNAIALEREPEFTETLNEVYDFMQGSELAARYSERHNINSAAVLTVIDDETAGLITERLAPRIKGKTVVEIGGGIGLLACHLGTVAERVYCIEANPIWSWTFAQMLLARKPKNVSYFLGAADEFLGCIKADVAIFCTHSDLDGMTLIASQFAPTVIDVYSELIAKNPEAFDPAVCALREIA